MTGRLRVAAGGVSVLVVLAALAVVLKPGAVPVGGGPADATLTVFLGTAQVTAAGTQNSAPVVSGSHLRSGDMVTTGPNSKADVVFGDGSQTRIDANTTVGIRRLSHDGSGFHAEIEQSVGKTWTRTHPGAGQSRFTFHAPNDSRAEIGSGELSIYIRNDAMGRTVVEIAAWSGTVDVSTSRLNAVAVGAGSQVAIGAKQSTPLTAAPVSPENRGDPFTIFNNAVTQSQSTAPVAPSGPAAVGTGRLAEGGETTNQPGVQVPAGGDTDVVYSLDWPGSTFELVVVDPEGREYLRQASALHPFSVVVPRVRAGQWSFKVHAVRSATEETWVVIVTTITPSIHDSTPFFVATGPCDHTVLAGAGADSWAVVARDPAGAPTLAVEMVKSTSGAAALPTWASFSAASGVFKFAPPLDTLASDLEITVSAAFSGQPKGNLTCTEHVLAAANGSTTAVGLPATGEGVDPHLSRLR